MIKLPKSVKVMEKLTISRDNTEQVSPTEALQKTVIGKKSDAHDRKESTRFANRLKQSYFVRNDMALNLMKKNESPCVKFG